MWDFLKWEARLLLKIITILGFAAVLGLCALLYVVLIIYLVEGGANLVLERKMVAIVWLGMAYFTLRYFKQIWSWVPWALKRLKLRM